MKKTLVLATVVALSSSAVWAGHANPWATEEDDLLMQYHEENLAQSIDTPGEDEMLGVMVREAHGKLDGLAGGSNGGAGDGSGDGSGGGSKGGGKGGNR
ncbi:hypothetical protein [Thioclava pacifica]|uniref:Uncharacterized protein n=1 Tax=Thioclava pacifica DSM 10166 TaxID=1353537 RepID=A0A074JF21_9RHOB|nr:hypothetical protein [Thioclava pacifica]KEO54490.1 hypothetical protein TP2_06060 [Thioclava pacifica DSM 10166]